MNPEVIYWYDIADELPEAPVTVLMCHGSPHAVGLGHCKDGVWRTWRCIDAKLEKIWRPL